MITDKQERFCMEYMACGDAAQAYTRAGYRMRGAKSQGARMLENKGIARRLHELQSAMDVKRDAERDISGIADADEILYRLTRILRGEEREQKPVTITERVPRTMPDGKIRYETKKRIEVTEVAPRISDVQRAAMLLGKQHGMFGERVTVEGAIPVIIDNVPSKGEQSK